MCPSVNNCLELNLQLLQFGGRQHSFNQGRSRGTGLKLCNKAMVNFFIKLTQVVQPENLFHS
jgi:hypothetical protein